MTIWESIPFLLLLAGLVAFGAKVTVYFNPRNPGEAVLEPGEQKGVAALVSLAGLFWWLFAILLVACR